MMTIMGNTVSTPEMLLAETVGAEIETIVPGRLTPEERQEMALRAIKIIDDYNRQVAIAAMEKAKQTMVEAAAAANNKPNST